MFSEFKCRICSINFSFNNKLHHHIRYSCFDNTKKVTIIITITRKLLNKIIALEETLQKTSVINDDDYDKILIVNDDDHDKISVITNDDYLKSFAEIFAISITKIIKMISLTTSIIIFKIDSIKNININYDFQV